LQDRFDTRALADRIDELLVHDTISEGDRAFIENRDMFFLATADAEGRPTCSYKGGEPGFVRVLDPHTLAFPNYDGNGMYLSTGNMLENPEVGLLFLDFERGHRMRLEGTATIDLDDPLREEYPEAQFVVRVRARVVYPNCPRYIHHYQLASRSRFVPRSDCLTPVPEWKRSEWAADALPAHDPARDPGKRDVIGR
jgi:predicted pyridoxine 5'-phosphate oxidase superfamily flavin-nucleotide-binding protein